MFKEAAVRVAVRVAVRAAVRVAVRAAVRVFRPPRASRFSSVSVPSCTRVDASVVHVESYWCGNAFVCPL